jgi:hypothetical protein
MVDYKQKCNDSLRLVAKGMDDINSAGEGTYTFDSMTASIIWDDELPPSHLRGSAHSWGLRPVFGYRATLILGNPDRNLEEYWLLAKELFPNWVGFLAERCEPNAELASFMRREYDLIK